MTDEGGIQKEKSERRYQLVAVGLILGSAVGFGIGGPVGAGIGAGIGLVLGAAIDAYGKGSK
jgi:hypothetical protein